ncbi:HPr family phosphocarrier protein [Blautia liquoris]|uniref:HPr family phosphocarrier protein n=1 Tax=Blautia liquoris TaxID=2779518 RepID=A0A7M2RCX9_9FIRM|nr:HPr family phosphocarrier protein [Blautia liquoris]QOV18136.1 HPr family phosphocarrier protein [Blautia liquoris]
MQSFQYVITDELGIHARPAGILAKEAKKYQSEIKIQKGEKEASATQLLKLMGLGIKCNDQVTVCVEGEDEESACEAMKIFFQENL